MAFRKFNDSVYILGLRFFYGQDEVLMGYIVPHQEKFLSLGNGFRLTGFTTAVGARGIMALCTVLENGYVSDWLGDPVQSR